MDKIKCLERQGNIFIGDISDGNNEEKLQEKNINLVMSLTDRQSKLETRANRDFIQIPIEDRHNPQYLFDRAVRILKKGLMEKPNQNVLIHCAAGASRSTAVTATVIAEIENKSFHKALETVKKYRSKTDPAEGIVKNAKEHLND